ncbi:VanZ like family protein [Ruminiclostridium hungatei]|uniref:VanZ like family protein n=1 Tax=Ruminiclostridium hungatei TaxID=48256 RepID=A0A1V4SQU3_RUMHU|nr:VanZ family protein [Ruminiclostridium hungatei]OPX46269.1 VanZ like family protein [Ruminiclostridium hungatei]
MGRSNKENMKKLAGRIALLLLAAYLLLLLYLTFFSPRYGRAAGLRGINLIPFSTIMQYLTGYMTTRSVIINLLGNIIAFMPMGFLLPLAFTSVRSFRRVLIISCLSTALVEITQYLTRSGISDIDDILLNVVGGILGYFLFKLFFYFLKF